MASRKTAPAREEEESLRLYMNAMGRIPLLTHADEIECGKGIEAGGEVGKAAMKKLVASNLRLVVLLARKLSRHGIPLPDAVQEGNLGLMRAAEKFNYRLGFRFSTYASWWIKQAIMRAAENHTRSIRIPSSKMTVVHQIQNAHKFLLSKLGREPTKAEIADLVGIKEAEIYSLEVVSQDTLSLDTPLTDETTSLLVDHIEDPDVYLTLEQLQLRQDKSFLFRALATLHPKEDKILRMRHGIGEPRTFSLDEIGSRFGLTRERIRQIEIKGLHRLRRYVDLHPDEV